MRRERYEWPDESGEQVKAAGAVNAKDTRERRLTTHVDRKAENEIENARR